MSLWETFRYELMYQARTYSTWFYFLLLLVLTYLMGAIVFVDEPIRGSYFLNAPYVVALVSLISFFFLGLLVVAPFAGNAAARDIETRMHPLMNTTPIRKHIYLGGRFLAAFTLGSIVMLAIPLGLVIVSFFPIDHAELLGPINPVAYISTYFFLVLPNTFIAVALMFAVAVFIRRGMISYLIAVLIGVTVLFSWQFIAEGEKNWNLAKLTDPLGITIIQDLDIMWTAVDKNALMPGLQKSTLLNRLLWCSISLGMLVLSYLLFKKAPSGTLSKKELKRQNTNTFFIGEKLNRTESFPVIIPVIKQNFDFSTRIVQWSAITRESFLLIAKGWGWVAVICLLAFVILTGPRSFSDYYDIPELPTTGKLLAEIENVTTHGIWLIIPLLIIYYAGELVWRERDARLNEIVGAAPVPVWVSFAGKFTGMFFALIVLQLLLIIAGILVQLQLGYYNFKIDVYFKILLGIRLADYVLLAALAFTVHVVLNQKYMAHMVTVIIYLSALFGPYFGIESGLLMYGYDPGWVYSDMRVLHPYIYPLVLYKMYWLAWALLLVVIANLAWTRGTENNKWKIFRQGIRKLSHLSKGVVASAILIIISCGGFIYYNTHILHPRTADIETPEWKADYEKKYRKYADSPQPSMAKIKLRAEMYPERGAVEFRGSYSLVNRTVLRIDTIYISTSPGIENHSVTFNRPVTSVLIDDEFDFRVYMLDKPLFPGDSLQLDFHVSYDPQGFPNAHINSPVVKNGSYFENHWLPSIGYQKRREILDSDERKMYALLSEPKTILEEGSEAGDRIDFEAIVGTLEGQIAIAPGKLVRKWTENQRNYFHYATDVPIKDKFGFFSADYSFVESQWEPDTGNVVDIQIFHHPEHTLNLERMMKGVQTSLEYLTRELGSYPHSVIRLVEVPGYPKGLFAYPMNILYREGFALLNPDEGQRDIDIPFATVAHEVAHQWWGSQLSPAPVRGAALLTESLAWFSALEIVEGSKGKQHFKSMIQLMRDDYYTPQARADEPLLKATRHNLIYRKGPLALYALREYIGKDKMRMALLDLFKENGLGKAPLPLPSDLYSKLENVTPDSLRYLLHDLFAANTFWELKTEKANVTQTNNGTWRVTMDVQARKLTVDTNGQEEDVEMNDLIQIGVYKPVQGQEDEWEALYMQWYNIRSGKQTIEIELQQKPSFAGIDPNYLLMDLEAWDNIIEVQFSDKEE